jgi:signal peptidase
MIYESKQVAALPVGRQAVIDRQGNLHRPRGDRGVDGDGDGTAGSGSGSSGLGALGAAATLVLSALVLVPAVVVLGAAWQGWRPVVIQTGSMEPAVPVGSLVVARPVAADDVAIGTILVMRPPGRSPVTHRVIDVDRETGLATTRGDANPSNDPDRYRLGDEELVARFVVANGGTLLVAAAHPLVPTALTTVAVLIVLPALFRRTASATWSTLRNGKKNR